MDINRKAKVAAFFLSCVVILFNTPLTEAGWVKTYGGISAEIAFSIQQTTDGGYIVAGVTFSFGADSGDLWVLKLDAAGSVSWQKAYGKSGFDEAHSIQQTTDGGYIVAGESGGDFSRDLWVLKLDSAGSVSWQKTYGGSASEGASSIQQTSDGGYIVAGETDSFGAGGDLWVLKLDSAGSVSWQKTYGGSASEGASSIQQTSDGGYIVAGYTSSFGAGGDLWVLKLDSAGSVSWQKTYGGSAGASSIQQASDGGYIVAGGKVSDDVWVLKLDSAGSVSWAKTYGGSNYDLAFSIQQTSDGGYIVAGYTSSFGAGFDDVWVLKLDSAGSVSWQKTYGGSLEDWALSIQQTSDGGYIVAGGTVSFSTGGSSDDDLWVLKLDNNGDFPDCDLMGTSTATVTNSSVTGVNSSASVSNSSASVNNTSATVTETNAETRILCEEQCGDSDGDGICDDVDNCPETVNPVQENSDTDSHGDACDNCPNATNENQTDSDGDGIGDACEQVDTAQIPTLSEWGMIIFLTIIMGLGVATLFRKRIE